MRSNEWLRQTFDARALPRRGGDLLRFAALIVLFGAIACATPSQTAKSDGSDAEGVDEAGELAEGVSKAPPREIPLPEAAKLPHPEGYDLGDLMALFFLPGAPDQKTYESCDADFKMLRTRVPTTVEFAKGVRELVATMPEKLHWCFYSKLLDSERILKSDAYIDEKQTALLETFEFVTPIARAFLEENKDSRYLRWAVRRYRRASDWVFHRRLELTPSATAELVNAGGLLEIDRQVAAADADGLDSAVDTSAAALTPGAAHRASQTPILEKYGLVVTPREAQRAPASTSTPKPTPSARPSPASTPRSLPKPKATPQAKTES